VNRKFCLILLLMLCFGMPAMAATCESLAGLKLPDTTITLAQPVAAGAFIPPGASGPPASVKNLPAFCRVAATLKPANGSEIKMEVWLPLSGWNGKYRGLGNGGFAGAIYYPGLAVAVSAGYASASTDTGHSGSPIDARWALGQPDKIVDFGWRAIHEMTVKAKSIIQAFYGDAPKKSYFAGCSNGGRQGLMEAQRFPEDYDGIIAGAPANYWTKVFATFIWDVQAMQAEPASYIGANKIPAIARAVAAACDANDGVKDGVLNDPRACHFDPKVLLCKEGDADSCLTAPQASALTKIYDGPVDAAGKQMFPGFLPGGEDGEGGWATWIDRGPGKDLQTVFAHGFYTNMISSKEPVDLKSISVETAVKLADDQQGQTFNATDPNLKPFATRGGKLIVYHGWSDAALPPMGSINYYNSVEEAMGPGKPGLFMRLFMVPGMQHCGGPGANSFGQFTPAGDADHDLNQALERWVEKGIAPDRLIATKFVDDKPEKGVAMTRPLCPYPEGATYKGTGDTNDAANFACTQDAEVVRTLKDPSVKAPRPLHTPDPKYSKSARKQKVEGVVTLSVIIGVDGKAHDVKVVKSLEPTLDANAIEAVKTWKFAPATKDGRPVAVEMRLEVDFKLW
jgi:feruloyl esterase